jgi:hypothetical protein
MPADEPPPHIDRFAPTTVNALMACMYRVALERARRVRRLPSPFTALGQVAHAMSERYWRGEFAGLSTDALESATRARWDDLVASQEAELQDAYPAGRTPRPTDWPGYALTRSRTLRTLRRLADARGTEAGGGRVDPEIELSDPASGLCGTIDRLEEGPSRLAVIDIKSGVWQTDVRPDQRRQLLLYAWLVWANRHRWPTDLAIETASGRREIVAFDAATVEASLVEARTVVGAYNEKALAGWGAMEAAASPGDDTCRGCPARLKCTPYWDALRSDWRFQGAARGTVATVAAAPEGATITFNTLSPMDRAGLVSVAYQVRSDATQPGDIIAIVSADERGAPGVLRTRWDTQVSIDARPPTLVTG